MASTNNWVLWYDEHSNLRVFQRDIRPVVADLANSRGGKFSMVFKNDDYINIWHTLISMVLSDGLLPQNFLTGLVLSVRPTHSTINVWVNSAQAYDDIDYMKSQLRLLLDVRKITFIKHGAVRTSNPFKSIDPVWNKRVTEAQQLKDTPSGSRGPRSCRSKLTPLEDPFLRTPTPAPEMVLASSGDSGCSSDDSCDKGLRQLGIAPQKKHGRSRRRGQGQKPKLLGNAEYEKALSMMSHGNTADPAAPRGFIMVFVTIWTRFWLFVNMLIDSLSSVQDMENVSKFKRWDQRFSVMCYAICVGLIAAVQGPLSSNAQPFNPPRVIRRYAVDMLVPKDQSHQMVTPALRTERRERNFVFRPRNVPVS